VQSVGHLKFSHGLHDGLFDVRATDDVVVDEEVVWDRDQSVFWPALKPVYSAAGYQPRKLQRPTTELLANLMKHAQKFSH